VQVGIFQVLYLNRTPDEAYAPLAGQAPYMPFRDASCGVPTFNLQPIDCIRVSSVDAEALFRCLQERSKHVMNMSLAAGAWHSLQEPFLGAMSAVDHADPPCMCYLAVPAGHRQGA
jgi:hypothetical protein